MDFYEIMLQQKLAKGSGSGSSDFSTAEVTINNQTDTHVYICAYDADFGSAYVNYGTYREEQPYTITAVLYKGMCWANVAYGSDPAQLTTTGDITYDSESEACIITGNGTITITISE